ncbi:uncharacterized protein LOC126907355 isoform X2 [Daktulosphaira vitifoliae]|uniref:uncharacterized protein LOC126907355 isoform X2 n=1 Tax=Daktulosphaira vitifoliae TaxID=58002 RepID=UPI0021A97EFA|nr:uncharacterized protein LOC126907355 isoform X2 [Daktulosphaira vitifoliae]
MIIVVFLVILVSKIIACVDENNEFVTAIQSGTIEYVECLRRIAADHKINMEAVIKTLTWNYFFNSVEIFLQYEDIEFNTIFKMEGPLWDYLKDSHTFLCVFDEVRFRSAITPCINGFLNNFIRLLSKKGDFYNDYIMVKNENFEGKLKKKKNSRWSIWR